MKLFFLLVISVFSSFFFPNEKVKQIQQSVAAAPQKIIIIMMDGFGEAYYRESEMPTLNFMEKHGLYKVVYQRCSCKFLFLF